MAVPAQKIVDRPNMREQIGIFRDREHAGEVLAEMLAEYRGQDALVLGIPAGGVPIGAVIAKSLGLPLDLAVVSKVTPTWNPEYGYGAVAFDGTVLLNEEALPSLGLSEQAIEADIARATEKVHQRRRRLRGDRPAPEMASRLVILADDGVATGVTTEGAIEALRKLGAARIILATPTGHLESLRRLAQKVDAVYCPNVRSGGSFAVAQAYRTWSDMTEDEIARIFREFEAPG